MDILMIIIVFGLFGWLIGSCMIESSIEMIRDVEEHAKEHAISEQLDKEEERLPKTNFLEDVSCLAEARLFISLYGKSEAECFKKVNDTWWTCTYNGYTIWFDHDGNVIKPVK